MPRSLVLATVLALAACGGEPPRGAPPLGTPASSRPTAPGTSLDDIPLSGHSPEEAAALYRKPYRFTSNWFTQHARVWEAAFAAYRDRPVQYLEIGTYEGRSALWMLDNVLTHPGSHMTVVDVFEGEVETTWLANLQLSGAAERVTTLKGRSSEKLRPLPLASYDIVYVDASHKADDALSDAVLAWDLLEPGGLLLFDDYGYGADWAPELQPATAIDAFLTAYRSSLEVLLRHHQVLVRKRVNPCQDPERHSPIGRYCFAWLDGRLLPADGKGEPLVLSDPETTRLRELLRSRAYGQVGLLAPAATPSPEQAALFGKLGVTASEISGRGKVTAAEASPAS